ncbi:MAG: hypothetical protein IJ829_03520, partial [Kiritimatiellae bacterium]|nr:hypothetical protein [Kiritimatiellia bacterium]
MTDAHCHVSCGDKSVRELLVGRDFFGVHPWATLSPAGAPETAAEVAARLRRALMAHPGAGVGEIGL